MDGIAHTAGKPFFVVAIAASAGGITAIGQILSGLPLNFPAAIVIVQHRADDPSSRLAETVTHHSNRIVLDAHEGDRLEPGCIFLAPPGSHLLVNAGGTLSLSLSAKVRHSRPAADRLLETAAEHLGSRLIAVILTGYDHDGATGCKHVKSRKGWVIAQDQNSSEAFGMPAAAIATGCVDWVLPLHEIGPALNHLVARGVA